VFTAAIHASDRSRRSGRQDLLGSAGTFESQNDLLLVQKPENAVVHSSNLELAYQVRSVSSLGA
jgi:hypothetical protein